MKPMWRSHVIPRQQNTGDITLSISKQVGKLTYEIQLCPTISLSVWIHDEKVKDYLGTNREILNVFRVDSEEEFNILWKHLLNAMDELETKSKLKMFGSAKKKLQEIEAFFEEKVKYT